MFPIKKFIIVLLLGMVALFIQGSLLKSFAPESLVVPHILLVIVVFLAFYDLSVSGVCLAFLLGIEMDLGTGILIGPWAAGFVAVYGMVSSISQRVFVESPTAIAIAAFSSSILGSFVFLAFLYQFRPAALDVFSFSFVMLFEAILTAVIAPIIFKLLKRLLLPRSHGSSGSRLRGVVAG